MTMKCKITGQSPMQDDKDGTESEFTFKALWENRLYFRWITTFVWALVGAFNFGILGDFSMFFIYIEEDLHASVMQLNWLGNIPWILFSVFPPICPLLAKHLGYRWTLIWSNVACAIGLFSTSFLSQVWPMYITYSIVFGGASIIYYMTGCVYITSYFDQKTCTGPVSSMGFSFELAILLFSPMIQVTADAWGWRWSIRMLSAGTLLVSGLLVIFIREPSLQRFDLIDGSNKNGKTNAESESSLMMRKTDGTCEKSTSSYSQKLRESDTSEMKESSCDKYMRMMHMPSFWLFELTIILSFTALSFSHINHGSYLTSIGVSSVVTAVLHSFLAGGGLFGRTLVLFITHKLPVPICSLYPAIAIMNCFLSFLILMTSSVPVLYIYSTAVGLLRALYLSLATGLAVELYGIENATQAYVALFFSYGVGGVLAAVLPGITHQLTGSYTVTVLICTIFWGVSSVLFAIIYLLFRRRQQRPQLDTCEVKGQSNTTIKSTVMHEDDGRDAENVNIRFSCRNSWL